MKVCQLKNIVLGEGRPKICLPIIGKNNKDILDEIKSFSDYHYDMIELRIDYYESLYDFNQVYQLIKLIREVYQGALLLTYRSLREGGQVQLTDEEYVSLIEVACQCDVDMIDVEVMTSNQLVYQMVHMIHDAHKKVILSYHDFEQTPLDTLMRDVLEKMEIMEGDVLKLAVMPHSYKDVIRLMNMTMEMSEKLDHPIVTMAMGQKGKISRIVGELTGSCMTFACASQASAPGQIFVDDMNMLLEAIHHD